MTSPFYAFADIHDSFEYLEDTSEAQATINTTTPEYKVKMYNAYHAFEHTYGIAVNKIHIPTVEETNKYLSML